MSLCVCVARLVLLCGLGVCDCSFWLFGGFVKGMSGVRLEFVHGGVDLADGYVVFFSVLVDCCDHLS